MTASKRQIKSHKGGRDSNLSFRLSSEEKKRLRAIAKRLDLSIPDYIMQCVETDEKKTKSKTL